MWLGVSCFSARLIEGAEEVTAACGYNRYRLNTEKGVSRMAVLDHVGQNEYHCMPNPALYILNA